MIRFQFWRSSNRLIGTVANDARNRGPKYDILERNSKNVSENNHALEGEGKYNAPKDSSSAVDILEETKKIVRKKQVTYFDPANTKLDLSLSNKALYDKIFKECETRMSKRYKLVSSEWRKSFISTSRSIELSENKDSKGIEKEAIIRKHIKASIQNAYISESNAMNPISIGDLVALDNDSLDLWIIVATPKDLESNSYTYLNCEGEVIFGPKQMIKLRFPEVIASNLSPIINELVMLEKKYLDIAPVGVPDAIFSKSDAALPAELQKRKVKNNVPSQENTGDIDTSERMSDFVVSQASSQLLTNSDVNTFHVPIEARNIYSNALKQISIKAFEDIPEIAQKLEILHRILQYDENEDLLDSPRMISIFQLKSYVEQFDLNMLTDAENTLQRSNLLQRWRSNLEDLTYGGLKKSPSSLGKAVPVNNLTEIRSEAQYSVSGFISLILALRMQGRLWSLVEHNSTYLPLSVNILPLRNVDVTNRVLNYLKFDKGESTFVKYVILKMKSNRDLTPPKHYDSIIKLFKDYIAGNLTNDPALETALVSILRQIDKSLKENKIEIPILVPALNDYSKVRAYEILSRLGVVLNKMHHIRETPSHWSSALQLPGYNVSMLSDFNEEFYAMLDSDFSKCEDWSDILKNIKENEQENFVIPNLTNFDEKIEQPNTNIDVSKELYETDPLAQVREPFGDVPVYCIDSEDAHEIDDGIAVTTDKNLKNYLVSIHVANPTSYIKPASLLSKVAFSKGFTSYFPEGPFMMLPSFISKLSGLTGLKETRTFVVEFSLDKVLIDKFILERQRSEHYLLNESQSQEILRQMEDSCKIRFCSVNQFPTGFTYNKVNNILNDPNNIKDLKSGCCNDMHVKNLSTLYHIATAIKNSRIIAGKGLEIDVTRSNVTVEYPQTYKKGFHKSDKTSYALISDVPECLAAVTITNNKDQDTESKSQTLVSNLMISANYLASVYASKNNIDIIHRIQQMGLEGKVLDELLEIGLTRFTSFERLSVEELSKIISVLNTAHFQVSKGRHDSLGVDGYATVTSPLRRYVDMINHWKFEEFALAQNDVFHKAHNNFQLHYISNHLRSCELINKRAQQQSNKFWEGLLFKEYIRCLGSEPQSKPINLKLLLKSNGKFGDVNVDIIGYNNLRGKLESTKDVIDKFNSGELSVGKTIEDNFCITRVDYIEGQIHVRTTECPVT